MHMQTTGDQNKGKRFNKSRFLVREIMSRFHAQEKLSHGVDVNLFWSVSIAYMHVHQPQLKFMNVSLIV